MIYDVAIIGAGPAGSTCALALRDAGLKVALLDKSEFPRDKVCGDAIPALCGKVLRSIDPQLEGALHAFPRKVQIASCRVVAPAGHHFEYRFQTQGWCSTRLAFDHFLLELAQAHSQFDYLPAQHVRAIGGSPGAWSLEAADQTLQARVIVGADGANGITAKALARHRLSPDHHCAAVRAYYQGIADLDDSRMEIHLIDRYLPGYFWIFPVGNGLANVGFGMMRNDIAKRQLSLRTLLPELVAETPGLAERFRAAQLQGSVLGFGLPLGARRLALSGDGFLLCGDAASLVEPATGEGIGNAMYSGMIAARTLVQAFRQNDFRAEALRTHDAQVYARLWKGMRQKYLAQRSIGGKKRLLNLLIGLAGKPGPVNWLMRKIF